MQKNLLREHIRHPWRLYHALGTSYPGVMRIMRFVISGGTATAVNLAILFALTHFAHLWYVLSSVIAFCLAFLISFVLQKIWTFGDTSTEHAHIQAVLFFAVIMAGLGINTILVYCLVEYAGVHYLAAQLISGVIIAVGNFFSYRHIVFRRGSADALPANDHS